MKLRALRDHLGADYRSEPLKPIGLRMRNALKPWLIRQPQRAMSFRLTSEDGRRFKLLHFAPSIDDKHRAVLERLRALQGVEFVPALTWSDDRHVLVEWVDGETPRADDATFARRLGEALAGLYRIGLSWPSRDDVIAGLIAEVRPLFESGRLPATCQDRLERRLSEQLPDAVPTAMLCGDPTLANFVLGESGALSMIDPSSFQPDLPIDIFFVGGDLYDAIDRRAFHEAYAEAGGIDFPFEHREPLTLFQLARASMLRCRVLDSTPLFEARRKRNLARSIRAQLSRLRAELER